jgi:hypothetical protein
MFVKDKHSSLFVDANSDKEKKFYNIRIVSNAKKWQF